MSGNKVPTIKVPESSAPSCEDANAKDSLKVEVSYDGVAQANKKNKNPSQSDLESAKREAECQTKIGKYREEYQQKVTLIEKDHQSKVQQFQKDHQSTIGRYEAECRSKVQKLETDHQSKMKKLDVEIESVDAGIAQLDTTCQSKMKELDAQIEKLNTEINSFKTEIERMKAEQDQLTAQPKWGQLIDGGLYERWSKLHDDKKSLDSQRKAAEKKRYSAEDEKEEAERALTEAKDEKNEAKEELINQKHAATEELKTQKNTAESLFQKQKQEAENLFQKQKAEAARECKKQITEAEKHLQKQKSEAERQFSEWKIEHEKRIRLNARQRNSERWHSNADQLKLQLRDRRSELIADAMATNEQGDLENVDTGAFLTLKDKYSQGKLKKEELRQFINAPVPRNDQEVQYQDRSVLERAKRRLKNWSSAGGRSSATQIPEHENFTESYKNQLIDNHSFQPIEDDNVSESEAKHQRTVSNTSTATTVIHEPTGTDETVTKEELQLNDNNFIIPQIQPNADDDRHSIASVNRKATTDTPRVSVTEKPEVNRATTPAVSPTQKPTRRETDTDLNRSPVSPKRVKWPKLKAAIATTFGGGAILAEILGLVGVINAWNPVGWLCLMAATAIGTGLVLGYYSKKSH
ncbi:MAG: hypothetical protein HUJ26_23040 [Planctomycetaceae bacterium]|nr:hypothetical protein [Planctomycetaceae bacterium]